MSRGKYALHYQLHALAPLVVAAALLRRQGFDLGGECDGALQRIVGFAVADLEDGALTQEITGKVQTFFDGTRDLEGFNLAWAEAYLSMFPDPKVDALVREWRPLSHSKLGGDQTALWAN